MDDSVYPSYLPEQFLLDDLLIAISKDRLLVPRLDADGLCRLHPKREGPLPDLALSTFIPLKKELIPPCERVWSCRRRG